MLGSRKHARGTTPPWASMSARPHKRCMDYSRRTLGSTMGFWTAYSNLNTAFRQRQSALALLEAATQSYSAALESYNYGVRSLLDVTAAQRILAQARSADVLARTQVLSSLAELAFRTADSIQPNKARALP